jgi:histidinol-phosphate aminotransferase
MSPRLTVLAQSLPATVPFVGPETQERMRGRPFRARLGANENGFGPSPRALAAISAAAGEVWKYGDPESFALKEALAAHLGVQPDNLAIGEGIDGLLGLAVRLYVEPGATVVSSLGAYPTFNYHVAGFGAQLVTVPYREDREDLDALLAAVRKTDAAMVYLANPDNPMGTFWPAEAVDAFAAALPARTMLVLDEAYGEFAPAGTLPDLLPLRPNVLRMRSFSKAYGLAGLRCGYAVAVPEVADAFNKVRNHFGLSRLAQAACLAALADEDHLAGTVTDVAHARLRIEEIAAGCGLSCIPSGTNFVAIDCGGDGALAGRVLAELAARDVFVRKPMAPGLDRCIRVSAGPDGELDIFAEALPAALLAARG